MKLIGIAGLKTAGKDSTYLAVQKALPDLNIERVGFADKLKVLAAGTFGYQGSDEHLIELMNECKEWWSFEIFSQGEAAYFTKFSGREYLQRLGQFARGVFGDSFWVDQVLPFWQPLDQKYKGVDVLCVTDVRYPNEAERVRELHGKVWRIDRPGLESDGHASEIELPGELVDVVIVNDTDLLGLDGAVERALAA